MCIFVTLEMLAGRFSAFKWGQAFSFAYSLYAKRSLASPARILRVSGAVNILVTYGMYCFTAWKEV